MWPRSRCFLRQRIREDAGSAIVEFCFLAIFLMLPLAFVIVAVFRVQDGAYAAACASREAGRAFVTADTELEARPRAVTAARIAMADHRLTLGSGDLTIRCRATRCLTPGAAVLVEIKTTVALPFVPSFLGGARNIHVTGHQLVVVDRFR